VTTAREVTALRMQLLEPRDSLVPLVAPRGGARDERGSAWLATRVARAGALGGFLASLVVGIPYYFAVRGLLQLPWLELAPTFVAFVCAAGAMYGAGGALGMHALAAKVEPRSAAGRALVAIAGAALGAAVVGVVPGALGVAFFGSRPYPFVGTSAFAVAPFLGAAVMSLQLARASDAVDPKRVDGARATVAAAIATAVFCALGAFGVACVDDATMLSAFRSGAEATSGQPESVAGLALVGAIAGALLGVGIGGQMGAAVALSGGPRVTPRG